MEPSPPQSVSLVWDPEDDESDSDYDDDESDSDDDDDDDDDDLSIGGEEGAAVVFVPASGEAVAGLEKQAFHAATAEGCYCAVTGCAICLENCEDGEEVTVMPCFRGHGFHQYCITKWLGKKNTCPLCRHALPTDATS